MGEKGSRIKLVKWMPVALWTWNIKVEICAICRNHIMDCCSECQHDGLIDDKVCTISWGKCNHAFHTHCISKWIKTKNVCPLDTRLWECQYFESH